MPVRHLPSRIWVVHDTVATGVRCLGQAWRHAWHVFQVGKILICYMEACLDGEPGVEVPYHNGPYRPRTEQNGGTTHEPKHGTSLVVA